MNLRCFVIILIPALILTCWFSAPVNAQENESIVGLWRLRATMPPGSPSEEVPEDLAGRMYYWFHQNGTMTLLIDEGESRNRRAGLWKKRGRRLMIMLENGPRFVVGVVSAGSNHLVLAGIDATPRWFRFSRVF